MENMKIAKKLVNVMIECSHVVKNGVNSFHDYTYAMAEDVLGQVNEALTKNKLASLVHPTLLSFDSVTTLKGNTEHLATISVNILIIDSESGESVEISGLGSGQDAGDKAVMKAQTAAIKYAYKMSLCMATDDDPEADIHTDEVTAAVQPNKKAIKAGNKPRKEAAAPAVAAVCTSCGVNISEKVLRYSVSKYGQPLCMDCQKSTMKAA